MDALSIRNDIQTDNEIHNQHPNTKVSKELKQENDNPFPDQHLKEDHSSQQKIYLFLEEVIYLHERGLLQVFHANENGNKNAMVPMQLPDLFALLDDHALSLAAYVTYAYLRSQTFIVLRHCERYTHVNTTFNGNGVSSHHDQNELTTQTHVHTQQQQQQQQQLQQQQQSPFEQIMTKEANTTTKETTQEEMKKIFLKEKHQKIRKQRDQMRENAFYAVPPQIFHWDDDGSLWSHSNTTHDFNQNNTDAKMNDGIPPIPPIAFDVYKPNTHFRRSNPGPPDYHVAIMDFEAPSPPFESLQRLVHACHSIPLRIATVSDSGTVVMFSITHGDVPDIRSNANSVT